jgi:hypothetical protein
MLWRLAKPETSARGTELPASRIAARSLSPHEWVPSCECHLECEEDVKDGVEAQQPPRQAQNTYWQRCGSRTVT